MTDSLKKAMYERLMYILKFRKDFKPGSHKLICLNRNKKIIFVELDEIVEHELTLYGCILPDDLFILGVFDGLNTYVIPAENTNFYNNFSLKEVYFMTKQFYNPDWIYEGDFRQKDSFYYLVPQI